MDEELTRYIVENLGRGIAEQDVILSVCNHTGVSWQEAESLVFNASVYRSTDVARRQLPILALLGVVFLLAGFGLIIHYIIGIVIPLDELSRRGISLYSWESLGQFVQFVINGQFVGELLLGAAMIVGGIVGLSVAIKSLT